MASESSTGTGTNAPCPSAKDSSVRPLISCVMVTKGRAALAEFAIRSFLKQDYPNRELVIVDDDGSDELESVVAAFARKEIRHVRLRDEQASLGALRNIGVRSANGLYVCQWDDDDLYDPCRLSVQFRALQSAGARACLLQRWLIWWPHRNRLAVSRRRVWEGSLLSEKAAMPVYPELRRGEDTPLVEELMATQKVVLIDAPRLYVYIVHGENTFGADHFDAHWDVATVRWEGARCQSVLEELGKRVPILAVQRLHGRGGSGALDV